MLTFIVWPITSGWCNLRLYRFWYIFFMLSYLKQVHGACCKGAANTLNALMSANLKRKLRRIKGTLSLICTHWPGSPQISPNILFQPDFIHHCQHCHLSTPFGNWQLSIKTLNLVPRFPHLPTAKRCLWGGEMEGPGNQVGKLQHSPSWQCLFKEWFA